MQVKNVNVACGHLKKYYLKTRQSVDFQGLHEIALADNFYVVKSLKHLEIVNVARLYIT
jgi:hypothetical protein